MKIIEIQKLILIIIFFGFISNSFSNNELIKSSLFENYNVSNGLSDEKIHCVFQDSKGWIWLGTDYGVFRFDGYEFSEFTINEELGKLLSNTLIRKIFEDSNGQIWIGTDFQGIFKYNREKNELIQYKDKGLSNNSVWEILEDSSKNLWLGTEGGLTYFNPQLAQVELTITKSNSDFLPGNWIRKLFIDKKNKLWIGSDAGIVVINKNNSLVSSYLTGGSYNERENEIWEIFQDRNDVIWVGTYLGGLLKYNAEKNKLEKFELDKNTPRSITVRSIIQDKFGDLWFGTRGGLFTLDANTSKINHYVNEVENNFSLIHNSVLNLLIDFKGDLWIGTRNGLSYLNFDKQAFGYLSSKKNDNRKLNNGEVYVIWEDPDDKLWIGTESGGINIYNPEKDQIKYVTLEQGLSSNCIKAICPDNNGNVLIGTYLGGLNIYNPQTGNCRVFQHNPDDDTSISDNEVWSIIKDSKGRIWVGTSKGLDLFDEKKQTFRHYDQADDLSYASMIFEDSRGYLWVYSSDIENVIVIKPFKSYKTLDIQSRAISEDIDGNIWTGTLGNGLLKFNSEGDLLESYTVNDGLPSNILNGIINVNNENLWISTNNGISKFSIEEHEFKNYYSSDGLLNNKFNYGAFYKTKTNSLVFGGKKGVDFVFLEKINRNDYIPPIVITGFRIFNKPVQIAQPGGEGILYNHISEAKEIELAYNQKMISFDFAALNYANSDKNKYKYKLEGFDKDWNEIGTARLATYTNLEHGEFIFKVIGSNNDNLYNEKGAELKVIVNPPLWKTTWFRLLSITFLLVTIFIVFVMIRNREKLKQELIYERQTAHKMKEVDRLKHQFFMNISHEIRTPLSLIIGPLDKIMSLNINNEILDSNLRLIKRNTDNLKKLVNQLLDYRKLETGNVKLELQKGNLKVFIENIVEAFKSSAEDKDIEINFKSSKRIVFAWFDGDKIEKILNNIISNALKYTHKGSISIALSEIFGDDIGQNNNLIPPLDIEHSKFKKYLKIKITDTGIGIAPDDLPKIFDRFRRIKNKSKDEIQGTGIGLALTKELLKIHEGHLRVKSQLGKGSRFSVFIPNYDDDLKDEGALLTGGLNDSEDDKDLKSLKQPIMLVVDDNPDLRSFIHSQFVQEYRVIEAKNGKDGWEKALDNIPDIIISDVMMPIMNGNDLCKRLKKDERTSHIPVIMLSALGSNENQLAGIDAGADDYLTKPFDIGLLKAKVDNIFSIRKSLRERYSKEMILKPKDIILASPDEKFLKKLMNIVEKNIAKEGLDVEFLAKNLDVSRTQLYRKISALTDKSPKEFVRELRLSRAAQFVVQNKMNISEIAYAVGFSDVSYFRKCFKEKFNMSASEYQKKNLSL